LAVDPKFVLARVNLGRALAARGRTDEAKVQYLRALEIDPADPLARQNLDKLLRAGAQPPAP
jgi:Flp pilus assembly protein TadD